MHARPARRDLQSAQQPQQFSAFRIPPSGNLVPGVKALLKQPIYNSLVERDSLKLLSIPRDQQTAESAGAFPLLELQLWSEGLKDSLCPASFPLNLSSAYLVGGHIPDLKDACLLVRWSSPCRSVVHTSSSKY